MLLIKRVKTPNHEKKTCSRLACDTRLAKKESYERCRTQLTIGDDLIDHEGDISIETGEITTIKMLWRSVMSNPGAKCITIDIKDMCLADIKEMDEHEYFQMSASYFQQKIINARDLLNYVDAKGVVY